MKMIVVDPTQKTYFESRIEDIEYKLYFAEFKVIDGLNQHPAGYNFEQWKQKHGRS